MLNEQNKIDLTSMINLSQLNFIKKNSIYTITLLLFLIYKFHDFTEPFAYGHTRWTDATMYWFGMMHLDLGLWRTKLMNIEGITDTGQFIYYLSVGSLEGILHSFMLYIFGSEPWAVRVIPLLSTILNLIILTLIGRKFFGTKCYIYISVIYLSCPFILKYGSSDVGFLSIPMSLGLLGWLSYFVFLEKKHQIYLTICMLCFSFGIFSNWQSAFMGLPIFFHVLFSQEPSSWKIKNLSMFSVFILIPFISILVHQGLITGDFYYPFKRVVERSKSADNIGLTLSWGRLFLLQIARGWQYFGQITCIFFLYWVIKLVICKTNRNNQNFWIIAFILTGSFWGFIFKNAAFEHDFLMLAFLPGIILAATSGALELKEDLRTLFTNLKMKLLSNTAVYILLILHLGLGVRSAVFFEEQEKQDLNNGEASVPFFLKEKLKDHDILVADDSSGYHEIISSDGTAFGNLKPHLAYLTRRPVRFVESTEGLEKLIHQMQKNNMEGFFVQLNNNLFSKKVKPPTPFAQPVYNFAGGTVFSLKNQI